MHGIAVEFLAGSAKVNNLTFTTFVGDWTGASQSLQLRDIGKQRTIIPEKGDEPGSGHITNSRIAEKDRTIRMLVHQLFETVEVTFHVGSHLL